MTDARWFNDWIREYTKRNLEMAKARQRPPIPVTEMAPEDRWLLSIVITKSVKRLGLTPHTAPILQDSIAHLSSMGMAHSDGEYMGLTPLGAMVCMSMKEFADGVSS